jgi:type II secretion system protein H
MMMWSTGKQTNNRLRYAGFTLIELMLVLVLLTIVISLVLPSLAKFFGGRDLDSEVRRFVSLTHYAQSRAVSEGVPMFIWVDPKAGTYGLEQEAGYTDGDTKAVNYTVAEGLILGAGKAGSKATVGKSTGIHFSPDGNVILTTSVSGISFQQVGYQPVWVVPTTNGLAFETQTQTPNARH